MYIHYICLCMILNNSEYNKQAYKKASRRSTVLSVSECGDGSIIEYRKFS